MTHDARSRGLLIAVEGLDGAGKTTFSRALAMAIDARWTTTPDPTVRAVREALEDRWVASANARRLFYAASVVACSDLCAPMLERGETVVVDRYWASTVAYAALDGAEIPFDEISRLVRPADVTFFLHVPHGARIARLGARGMSASDRRSVEREAGLAASYERALVAPHAGLVLRIEGGRPTRELVCEARDLVSRCAEALRDVRPVAPHVDSR